MQSNYLNYKSETFSRILLKIFVVRRNHNGTALLICEAMTRCDTSNAIGRWLQTQLKRRLNRRFGCFVSPTVQLGARCLFPHPIGIVIGEGVVIGDDCVIYQNVTLGAPRRGDVGTRYPVLEDRVVVYAGAVVVGAVSIGADSIVAANAVVTQHVAAGSMAAGVPAVTRPLSKPASEVVSGADLRSGAT